MCNVSQDVMDKLAETVRNFLNEERMFTAYDVTVSTREREKIQLRHQDVGGACHEVEALKDALDFGHDNLSGNTVKWYRDRRDVPLTNGAWTWIYYPAGFNPDNYQFSNHKSYKSNQSKAAVAAKAPALSFSINDGNLSDSGGENDDGTFSVDCRNRLRIPTRFMRDCGMKAGDLACIWCDGSSKTVSIFKYDPSVFGVGFTTQKVEKDGEIRISFKTLSAANMKSTKFAISTSSTSFNSIAAKAVSIKIAD